ncbi:MAG TPA: MBL fold metallo-hydrolase [Miltoncostaea sp.]|nr:MBL fold metallo-hydrolase [Miltoncostaea sp.]
MEPVALRPVDAIAVTILVDNVADSLLPDQGPAVRAATGDAPRVPVALFLGGDVDDALRAEHGFSALVTVTDGDRTTHVLFDAGRTPDGLVENMRRLRLDPRDIGVVVLSHGHWDHVTGMEGLVGVIGRAGVPVVIHPAFWRRRRIVFPGGRAPLELPTASPAALRGAGFAIVEDRRPSFLLDGALLVTGEVDRTTAFERGFPGHEAHGDGGWEPDPLILDDQALLAHVRGRGLVVLTGCGHAGIVNILRHASRLTGVERIHAVVGGFHLSGAAFEAVIGPTCDALAPFAPDHLVPAHCTGWRAQQALAARFPEAFIPSCVGTRLTFAA